MRMINRSVCVSALCGLAGACEAGFDVRSADTSSPNSPITGSANFFQSSVSGASWGPPSIELAEAAIADPNDVPEYDSYVAIACGPTVPGDPGVKGDGFEANPGDLNVIGGDPFSVPNQVRAVWFKDPASGSPEEPACPNPLFGGRDAMLLARLSFRSLDGTFPNETVSLGAGGLTVDIRDSATLNVGAPSTDSLLVRFMSFGTSVQQGMDGGDLSIHPLGSGYELLTHVSYAGPRSGGTARWQIHDLYVVAVPAPSASAAMLIACCAWSRRRSKH